VSGGYFDNAQFQITQIADSIENLIENKSFDDVLTAHFQAGLKSLRTSEVYAQRIDWLVSGDDSAEEFLARLTEDLDLAKKIDGKTNEEKT